MPVALDCSDAESQLSHTPLPVPAFFKEAEYSFSVKKTRRQLPPPPRHKCTLSVSRIFSDRRLQQTWSKLKPRSVSFRGLQKQKLPLHSHLYDISKKESFFKQCFQKLIYLGGGSFGKVYKVRSREDGQLYAVKRSVGLFRGEADRQRKLAEVRKHECVGHHPNCVSFVQAWEECGQLYIQTELCLGTLLQYCEEHGPLSEWQVQIFLWDILQGLRHLHGHNLLHMDIKPANIFLSSTNVCKLGDFGVMLELDSGDLKDAQEGDPRYMAPELLRGEYTKAADVFSLGITILEIACNMELPNGGKGWQQLRQGYLPSEFTAGLSVELQELLIAMLEPNHLLRPSVEMLLNSSPMKKIQRWRKLVLLAYSGIQHGTFIYKTLLRFMQWLWGILFSPAKRLLFWQKTVPVTPPHSPFFPPLENSSLSSDWGEDEDDKEAVGKDVLEVLELSKQDNHTCPVELQTLDKQPSSLLFTICPFAGSTSTPEAAFRKRSFPLQESPNLSCIGLNSPCSSPTSSNMLSANTSQHRLTYDETEDKWESVSSQCLNQCSPFEPKNLLSLFED
ncbi:membrane-associated tyrosine- and threonine-specific cdc2-inhibitory kinase-like [Erythrolamprus reginae]|uniref:membrane-associated tyrosine- and threonine-specific cdc2-inhibitory kinase-like n=1 Tax=Erythrolamprus reginae TaxID=121349 RepID=UPI00396C885D